MDWSLQALAQQEELKQNTITTEAWEKKIFLDEMLIPQTKYWMPQFLKEYPKDPYNHSFLKGPRLGLQWWEKQTLSFHYASTGTNDKTDRESDWHASAWPAIPHEMTTTGRKETAIKHLGRKRNCCSQGTDTILSFFPKGFLPHPQIAGTQQSGLNPKQNIKLGILPSLT